MTAVNGPATISIGDRTLTMDDNTRVGWMTRTDPRAPVAEIRRRLEEDGYCFLPGLVSREKVLAAQRVMTAKMEEAGDLLDSAAGERALQPNATPRIPWKTGWLQEQPEVMAVVEGPELFDVFERIFAEPASTFDYKWYRTIGPGRGSAFHFDGIYMCRAGSPEQSFTGQAIGTRQHTVWVPWCDVPLGESGLTVIEGSHRLPGFQRLRETLGDVDVNYTDLQGGFSFRDPLQALAYDQQARLVTSDFLAGDVVLFGMYTLHGSSVNATAHPPKLRLSCDIRFQPKSDPVDKRHTADGRVCHGIDEKNRHPGPYRSFEQALEDWGCLVTPTAAELALLGAHGQQAPPPPLSKL